jgi:hypothetical protein
MVGMIIFYVLGGIVALFAILCIVFAFVETDFFDYGIVAAFIAAAIAIVLFTGADACRRDYVNANGTETEIVAIEYEREV